jgi:cob(I)alamin adenosyltransferase
VAIYTKKGDRGKASLYDVDASQRKRISKASLKIEAVGSLDELNSYIGVVVSYSEDRKLSRLLEEVQDSLLRIGSITAGSSLRFSKTRVAKLERVIDGFEVTLPPLKNFIIPGGDRIAAHLHYARTLARKAERKMVALNDIESVKPQVLVYLNRLSDFFFMLAREASKKAGATDKPWKPRK